MFEKTFTVGIYSPDKLIYEGPAVSLIAPCVSGYLGVLANHAPLVAKLAAGKITLRLDRDQTRSFDISAGGFLEVLQNKATILFG